MTLEEAFKDMGIEDLLARAMHSNSNGELFHLQDYFMIHEHATQAGKKSALKFDEAIREDIVKFFLIAMGLRIKSCVKFADENWERPASAFQHMPRMLNELTAKPTKEWTIYI